MAPARATVTGAAAAVAAAAAAWLITGGPLGTMVGVAAPAGALIAVALATVRPEWWDDGRGAVVLATAVAVAAAPVAVLLGRPDERERWAVAAGAIGALGGVVVVVLDRSRRARTPTERDAIDVVVARMTRAVPVDENLQQVVEVLRDTPERRSVELWQRRGDHLELTHRAPLVDRPAVEIDDAAARAASTAGPIGEAWLTTWLPELARTDDDGGSVRAVPLAVHGDLLGVLVLRSRADESPLGPHDDERLRRVQRPLAVVLNDVRLRDALQTTVDELRDRNDELQASRSRLVSVADAERRRLERDLHDGAQAGLTALGVKLQLARLVIERSPELAGETLAALGDDVAEVVAELRRLAHGIHPPLLLTGGLGDALRGAASRSSLDVRVDPIDGTRFRPELEAAVYYCCVEALQNVAKHAGPRARAVVRIDHDADNVFFSVTDDGVGLSPEYTGRGHGLVNMADRMGAVGGSVVVEPRVAGGTVVRGQAPLASPSPEPAER